MYNIYIFLFSRLIQYELDSENDDVANYIILSLQFEPMIPGIEVNIFILFNKSITIVIIEIIFIAKKFVILENRGGLRSDGEADFKLDGEVWTDLHGTPEKSRRNLRRVHSDCEREDLLTEHGRLAQQVW